MMTTEFEGPCVYDPLWDETAVNAPSTDDTLSLWHLGIILLLFIAAAAFIYRSGFDDGVFYQQMQQAAETTTAQ